MKYLHTLLVISIFCITVLFVTSGNAQNAGDVRYKIAWDAPKNVGFSGAYAVMQADSSTSSKSFDATFPVEADFFAPPHKRVAIA